MDRSVQIFYTGSVRGDSLRDLYAKVLALCGLGLLAGAGALVDYWPVQGELPRVASLPQPVPVRVPRAASLNARVAVPAVLRREARSAPVAARPTATAHPLRAVPSTADVPVGTTVVQAISAGPAVREFAPPPAAVHAGDDRPALPALPEPVDGVPTLAASLAGFAPAPIAALETASNHSDEGDGFLSGAFKKTGAVASASIVKTGDVLVKSGAVAGASIVDVFRGLAGAMKKVSPFVP